MQIICTLLGLYLIALLLRIVLSWFPGTGEGTIGTVYGLLTSITEPILGPMRRVLPTVQFGGAGLDLSPMVVMFLGFMIYNALCG